MLQTSGNFVEDSETENFVEMIVKIGHLSPRVPYYFVGNGNAEIPEIAGRQW